MKRRLENSKMVSDLDCDGHDLLNCGLLDPVPSGLLSSDDPRLSDQRPVPDGSVTDIKVSVSAGIVQSKLNLDGNIPLTWLGTGSNQAAQGDLYQPIAQKGVANGYVPLDSDGRIPSGFVTPSGNLGTVTVVGLQMPGTFESNILSITGSGIFNVTWLDFPDNSWFGRHGTMVSPFFQSDPVPMSVIPDLDASKFTSGTFSTDRLPLVTELGVSHHRGILPDPGEVGEATDYFGRDASWQTFQLNISYQPEVTKTKLAVLYYDDKHQAFVQIETAEEDAVLFYRLYPSGTTPPTFLETANPTILIAQVGDIIQRYAAKAGFNNSVVGSYVVPPPPISK